jgi:glycosyltransferase involved in cell wall biosynthesis
MRLTDLVTPLKPLEAMAQGKLLMASDVGGHLELIQDKKTGVIFKSDNPDALVTEVLDLLSRQDRWPALRAAARNYVETERNWPVSVARYKDVYGSLVNKEILG